jgi:hypothetical protein
MAYHGVTWHSCLFSDNPSRCPLPCRPFPVCTHCGRRSLLLVTLVPYLYCLTQIPCPTLALRVAGYLFCFSHEVPLEIPPSVHCAKYRSITKFSAHIWLSVARYLFYPSRPVPIRSRRTALGSGFLPSDLGSLKWAPVPLPPRLTFVSVDNAFVPTEPGMFSWPLRIRPWVPLNPASPTLARGVYFFLHGHVNPPPFHPTTRARSQSPS